MLARRIHRGTCPLDPSSLLPPQEVSAPCLKMYTLLYLLAAVTFCQTSIAAPTTSTSLSTLIPTNATTSENYIPLELFESELHDAQVRFQRREPAVEDPLVTWITVDFVSSRPGVLPPGYPTPKIGLIKATFLVSAGPPRTVVEYRKIFAGPGQRWTYGPKGEGATLFNPFSPRNFGLCTLEQAFELVHHQKGDFLWDTATISQPDKGLPPIIRFNGVFTVHGTPWCEVNMQIHQVSCSSSTELEGHNLELGDNSTSQVLIARA